MGGFKRDYGVGRKVRGGHFKLAMPNCMNCYRHTEATRPIAVPPPPPIYPPPEPPLRAAMTRL